MSFILVNDDVDKTLLNSANDDVENCRRKVVSAVQIGDRKLLSSMYV